MKEPEEESNREPLTASIAIDYNESNEHAPNIRKQRTSLFEWLCFGIVLLVLAGMVLPALPRSHGHGSSHSQTDSLDKRALEIGETVRAMKEKEKGNDHE